MRNVVEKMISHHCSTGDVNNKLFDQTTNQGISTLNSKTLPNLYENLPGLFQIIMN